VGTADEVGGGGSWYKLRGPGSPEGGPSSDYLAYVFVFLGSIIIFRQYKSNLSDYAQDTLATDRLSDLVERF
jgi:hypothetical protein